MMKPHMKIVNWKALSLMAGWLVIGCGSTSLVQTPVEKIDEIPLKIAEMSDNEAKTWGHADLKKDTIPGMSVDRAYREILSSLKGKTVVVAVLDTGIDLGHEDLDDVLWTNKGERPGNGKDDDNNGFVDDVHGYNFLGASFHEQMETARILRLKLGDAALRAKARETLEKEASETATYKQRYEQILQVVKAADEAVKEHLGKPSYEESDVDGIQTQDPRLQQHIGALKQMYAQADSIDEVMEQLRDGITHFTGRLNYHFNVSFEGRAAVGDNPYDLNDRDYGDGNPGYKDPKESHGTHVAGIIAAERNNGIGVKGVADKVEIMAVRVVPDGDEYDKDIALGIRYAVDNGASIINASFGKSFSPNAEWVSEAIEYAAQRDVLIVHASGNDGLDLDDPANQNFPNDQVGTGAETVGNVITVGSIDGDYGSEVVSGFSNYGASNVDIFAPGGRIYSTMPDNEYEFQDGTSMAAPGVAGMAAVIRSRFPKLSASQVKQIIMKSGLALKPEVVLGGDPQNSRPFSQASRSGRIANLYNALIMAQRVEKGQLELTK